jgi:S-methylmethionine-dependent homocysteine/selenocysteine methylase
MGAPFSQPLWSAQALIEAPEYVRQAHCNFIQAGADIITINSYACVPFHLGTELYNQKGPKLATQAAILAREAVQTSDKKTVLVAGSLPPVMGSYRPDLFEPKIAFDVTEQLYAAQDPYCDLWIAETIASIAELKIMLSFVTQSSKPFYIAFTLSDDVNIKTPTLRSGEHLSEAIDHLREVDLNGILFNCSIPEVIEPALLMTKTLQDHLTIGAYANSFIPIDHNHKANSTFQSLRSISEQTYLHHVQRWYEAGAKIIGGCCGIGPSHIAEIAQWKEKL